jgi:hypothetical protein
MSSDTDPTRRYTEQEVRLIIKSAAELQQRQADRSGELSGGMSLVELEQVAGEVGIDPSLVRRAAARIDATRTGSDANVFLGSPTHILLERVVDVTIDPGQFDQLLDIVRAVSHEVGEVSTVGRQFGWKGRLDGAKADVNVSVGDVRTTLRVRVAMDEVALGHFMVKGVLFGFGGGLIGSAVAVTLLGPAAFALGAGTLATGYVWARRGFRGETMQRRARAAELLDALAFRTTRIAETKRVSAP